MTILDQMINLMLEKVEVVPVPKQELDDFLSQNNIDICDEHYQFLLKYGNSGFLKYGYADFAFKEFIRYYLNDEKWLEDMVPDNCCYLGMDYTTELVCVDNKTGKVYGFDSKEKNILYYGGIREILFFSLFQLVVEKNFFDKIETNIKIEDIEKFKSDYLNYEIKDIYRYNRYFFKDKKLIICDDKFYSYNIYYGGILDKIIDDRTDKLI